MTKGCRRVIPVCLLVLIGSATSGGAQARSATSLDELDSLVALGDSLFAGFANGGLVEEQQRSSVPALVADALRNAGASIETFEQPLVSEPGVPPLLELVGTTPLVIAPRAGPGGVALNDDLARPFDNLAVPGFGVGDAAATETGNAIIDLVLRGRGTALAQALERKPKVALVWLGSNDVLPALTSGVVIDDVTLTPPSRFRSEIRDLVSSLRDAGIEVVLLEIPQLESIPFVTTVSPVVTDSQGVPILVDGATVPLLGPDGPLSSEDRVLLSARGLIAAGTGVPVEQGGSGMPLPGTAVLSADERATVRERTVALNQEIREAARDLGAFASARPARALTEAAERWQSERCPFASAEQPFGRFFSLDGVHPTIHGATVLANALLEDLEELFGVQLPLYLEEGCAGTAPFTVTATWTTPGGDMGIGHPIALSRDTVYFWFFDPKNVELLVKVLDGCVINGRHWVFAAGLTDVGVELTVTDTRDGSLRTYTHAPGTPLAPVQDTSAFDRCP